MITLHNLIAGYAGKPASPVLHGCFQQGSMTALTGANGSGKSTLLKTLAGLQKPVAGKVSYSSSPVSTAWLPQRSELEKSFPVSVFDVVAMGCWKKTGWFGGMSRQQRQAIMKTLDQVGMAAFARAQPGRLSGGQLQRVLFARLLMQDAELLLLDEPFTGVDSETTKLLLNLLQARNRAGCTLIVVLHDHATVERYFSQRLHLAENHAVWQYNTQHIAEPVLPEIG